MLPQATTMNPNPQTHQILALATLALLIGTPTATAEPSPRQAEVAQRGTVVMPFDLNQTRHIFTKTPSGGVQQVVALNADDQAQIGLIRQHLKDIANRFSQGDFSGPAYIHGEAMPGLQALRKAQPGQWQVEYKDLANGAEVDYSSAQPELVRAIHAWFDAQLTDHGQHAMPGHHPGMMHPQ